MAAGKRKRGGTSSKKREAMSKFGARVEPNDQKPAFDHAVGMVGAAKFPIEGKHPIKHGPGRRKRRRSTVVKREKRRWRNGLEKGPPGGPSGQDADQQGRQSPRRGQEDLQRAQDGRRPSQAGSSSAPRRGMAAKGKAPRPASCPRSSPRCSAARGQEGRTRVPRRVAADGADLVPVPKPLPKKAPVRRQKKPSWARCMHDLKHGPHHNERTHEQEVAIAMKTSGSGQAKEIMSDGATVRRRRRRLSQRRRRSFPTHRSRCRRSRSTPRPATSWALRCASSSTSIWAIASPSTASSTSTTRSTRCARPSANLPWPNAANITLPIVHAAVNEYVSRINGTIFAPRLLTVRGNDPISSQYAHLTEEYYNTRCDKDDWTEAWETCVHLAARDGISYSTCFWELSTHEEIRYANEPVDRARWSTHWPKPEGCEADLIRRLRWTALSRRRSARPRLDTELRAGQKRRRRCSHQVLYVRDRDAQDGHRPASSTKTTPSGFCPTPTPRAASRPSMCRAIGRTPSAV